MMTPEAAFQFILALLQLLLLALGGWTLREVLTTRDRVLRLEMLWENALLRPEAQASTHRSQHAPERQKTQ